MYTAAACLHPGDTVLADNCMFHAKRFSAEVVAAFLEQLGVNYILIPKYSPELNPIELVFSLLKVETLVHLVSPFYVASS